MVNFTLVQTEERTNLCYCVSYPVNVLTFNKTLGSNSTSVPIDSNQDLTTNGYSLEVWIMLRGDFKRSNSSVKNVSNVLEL